VKGTAIRLIVVVLLAAFLISVPAVQALARPRWSDWSTPVALGSNINTASEEQQPAVSKDGLTLYFSTDRTGGQGGTDIWLSYRASTDAAWGVPANLGTAINTAANEGGPALSRDGHWLFLGSDRADGMGFADIWVSYRQHTHVDFGEFGWQPARPVAGVNTAFGETNASYFQDDAGQVFLFFQSGRPGGLGPPGTADIYVAVQQSDGSFGDVSNVTALNTPRGEQRPSVTHDGLEIFFMSNRASTLSHIWTATRESTTAQWSTPVEVTAVRSAGSDQFPHISPDGQTLYFGRSAGVGAPGDLYVATRTKETGKP
jgi:Tol biopolymer transport system component